MYQIIKKFPAFKPYESDINLRMERYQKKLKELLTDSATLSDFSNAYEYYGFHQLEDGWVYREWAPGADAVYLTGDFNSWNWTSHPLKRLNIKGDWEIHLSDAQITNGSRVRTIVKNGTKLTEHIPLYARRVVQNPENYTWCCEVYDHRNAFPWTDHDFSSKEPLLIYESHIGMAQEEPRIGTYLEFAEKILPRIQKAGYNTIQLMAIMEHPFYGSFGYQVSNFYAASSRYGTPDDLKYLINKAHSMGIRVLLDVVHSHAVKNTAEGINLFDGTTSQFFHEGARGEHSAWGTKCFNYENSNVIHFLLSNLKFWMTEFHFDGFRFDGVTSMLYLHHGLGINFDSMKKYFSMDTDLDAVTYLQLANKLIHDLKPDAITIAEDMSGMPGMTEPIPDGGIGFNYRLAMGLPDLWIKYVKEVQDENWDLDKIWKELTFREASTISYLESHDQALVGDQTMMFRLAGSAMYNQMQKNDHSFVIDRAMALHKMLRLLIACAGGDGYLNFMGNEFGHPEWIDFPRPGNNSSYQYCRRQWSLSDNPDLKYQYLNLFDHDMIRAITDYQLFTQKYPDLRKIHNDDKIIAFERKDLLFVFNFNPSKAFNDYPIPVSLGCDYEVLFTTDDICYGGYGRLHKGKHSAFTPGVKGNCVSLYLPPRTALVLRATKPLTTKAASEQPLNPLPQKEMAATKVSTAGNIN